MNEEVHPAGSTYFEIALQFAHDILKLFLKLNIVLIEKTKSFQSMANLGGALGDLNFELLRSSHCRSLLLLC
jgi:hypothetical protein